MSIITETLQRLTDYDFRGIKVNVVFDGAIAKIAFYETNPAIERVIQQHDIMQSSQAIEWQISQAPRKWMYQLNRFVYYELEHDLMRNNPTMLYHIYEQFRHAWLTNLQHIQIAPVRETITIYEPAPKKPSLLKRFLKALDKLTTPPVEIIEAHPKGRNPKTGEYV